MKAILSTDFHFPGQVSRHVGTARYVEFCEHLTGETFRPAPEADAAARIERNVNAFLKTRQHD